MIRAAYLALTQAISPPFRLVLMKSVGLALLLLILFGIGLQWFIARLIEFGDYPNLEFIATIIASLGIFAGLIFLVPPVTSLVAGVFLDEIADTVEKTHYPQDPSGKPLPMARSLLLSLRFFGIVLLVNIAVLILIFVPVVNVIAYLVGNGYLLGREYFTFAAMRFGSEEEATALRKRHGLTVFLGGVLIALFAGIPVLNLATPIVAASFMVHLHKRISAQEARRAIPVA